MSFEGLLDKTCDISRVTAGSYSGPEPTKTWANVSTGVACRRSMIAGRELDGKVQAAVGMHKIFLPYGTDVTEKDRITMGLSVYEVEFVNPDAGGEGHHVEVLVKETKA